MINYTEKIPNNVDLGRDRVLQRALEHWQPAYMGWWYDMVPNESHNYEVYLRTATSVEPDGWAQFGYVKMPEYRWGIFLQPRDEKREVNFGTHKGQPAWQEVPGEYRSTLRRVIVTQGDTEPASVEQQRMLGESCPSMYDLRNIFQVNVEEGRHLWAMVYLLHRYFGLARLLHVHVLYGPRRQVPALRPRRIGFRPAGAHLPLHADRRSAPHVCRGNRGDPHHPANLRGDERKQGRRSITRAGARSD